jgi:hypothetical protein
LNNRSSALVGFDDSAAVNEGYRRSEALSRELMADDPGNSVFRRQLLIALQNEGDQGLLDGHLQAASRVLAEAEMHGRTLVASDPDSTDFLKWRFKTRCKLSACLGALGWTARSERTEAEAREFQTILEKATGHLDQEERLDLAQLLTIRSRTLLEQGRWKDATSRADAAAAEWEAVARGAPDDWTKAVEHLIARAVQTEARARSGRCSVGEAVESCSTVLRDLAALQARFDYPRVRAARGNVSLTLADLQSQSKANAHVLATLAPVIPDLESLILRHPGRPSFRFTLARALAQRSAEAQKQGRIAEAMADARRSVEALEPLIGEGCSYLYELGAMQSLCLALARTYPEARSPKTPIPTDATCLDSLAEAVAGGYDNTYRLEHDPRLQSVRGQARFQKLIELIRASAPRAESP